MVAEPPSASGPPVAIAGWGSERQLVLTRDAVAGALLARARYLRHVGVRDD